jgi:hypothetical protein
MIVRKPSETYPFLNYRYDTMIIDLILSMIILKSICKTDDYLYI